MRNKRWHIRRALVADLRTDPMIANSRGRTVRSHALTLSLIAVDSTQPRP